MAKMFYDNDADLAVLKGLKVAVLGYGSQGHAQAQNLRDSGLNVVVGEKEGTPNYKKAIADGFTPVSAAEAVKGADYVQILLPDELQAIVYKNEIAPNLKSGAVLGFSHGFNIHFQQIQPPADVDVIMVAPKGPGHLLRRVYVEGVGMPGLLAIYQDATGNARAKGMAYAKGISCTKAGVIETTFKEETETDLFGEQAVLCGGISHLITAGFETLVEAGYQPEIAYFECLHESKLIIDLIYENGIGMMRYSVSDTAEWGDLISGPRVISAETKAEMKKILTEIQDGTFARNWILENQSGRIQFNALAQAGKDHQIEKVGKQLRDMMPWLQNHK